MQNSLTAIQTSDGSMAWDTMLRIGVSVVLAAFLVWYFLLRNPNRGTDEAPDEDPRPIFAGGRPRVAGSRRVDSFEHTGTVPSGTRTCYWRAGLACNWRAGNHLATTVARGTAISPDS